jgi:hypothetical protein
MPPSSTPTNLKMYPASLGRKSGRGRGRPLVAPTPNAYEGYAPTAAVRSANRSAFTVAQLLDHDPHPRNFDKGRTDFTNPEWDSYMEARTEFWRELRVDGCMPYKSKPPVPVLDLVKAASKAAAAASAAAAAKAKADLTATLQLLPLEEQATRFRAMAQQALDAQEALDAQALDFDDLPDAHELALASAGHFGCPQAGLLLEEQRVLMLLAPNQRCEVFMRENQRDVARAVAQAVRWNCVAEAKMLLAYQAQVQAQAPAPAPAPAPADSTGFDDYTGFDEMWSG